MCEDVGKEVLIESAKAVAVETYRDSLHPAMQAAGNVIALPFQAIDIALSKPKLWVAEKQYNFERTKALLAEKLKNTPPENIVPPENYVAVPALQQISYCFDSDELREMYANLLAVSMQVDKRWEVHPSFVEIIRQICPDEAKILQYIVTHNPDEIPVIDLFFQNDKGEVISMVRHFSNLGELAQCDYPSNICKYFDNLVRLGIIEHGPITRQVTGDNFYEPLRMHKYILEISEQARSRQDGYNNAIIQELYMYMTDYGKSFCKLCLNSDS